MGQVLHGSATTTEAVRRAIQHSQASLRALAKRYGINQKTVAKWKGRTSVADLPTGPEETQIDGPDHGRRGGGRRFPDRHSLLPLDDCLYALQPTIAHLTRARPSIAVSSATASADCLRWKGDKEPRRTFKTSSDRLLPRRHRRSADLAQGKLYLFVAIDRTSKLRGRSARPQGQYADRARLLGAPVAAVPYRVEIVLTDNGDPIRPTCPRTDQAQPPSSADIPFDRVCREHGIEHRLTKTRIIPGPMGRSSVDEPDDQGGDRQAMNHYVVARPARLATRTTSSPLLRSAFKTSQRPALRVHMQNDGQFRTLKNDSDFEPAPANGRD